MNKKEIFFKIMENNKEYKLLTNDVVDCKIKIEHLICHHIWNCNYISFVNGHKCPVCSKKNGALKTREKKYGKGLTPAQEKLLLYIKDKPEYIFIEFIDSYYFLCHHTKCDQDLQMRVHNFIKGHGCKRCSCRERKLTGDSLEKFRSNIKKTWSKKTKEEIESINNKIRTTTKNIYGVENGMQSEEIKEKARKTCLNKYGVEHASSSDQVKNKIRIGIRSSFYNNRIQNFDNVIPKFDLNEYDGVKRTSYKWECKTCHSVFENRIEDGRIPICRTCNPIYYNKSTYESEIKDFINQTYNGNIIKNHRDFYAKQKYYELDVYIPDMNFGIELDGIYWHSELGGNKNKNYHLSKTKYFLDKNIQIIHIFETEWINKKELIKSIISSKMNIIKNKIYARKCIIKEIESKILNDFIEQNHIQGMYSGSCNIGLYYNEELVSVISFGKSRFNKKYEWELLRFCNKLNTAVVGGFSKLLSHFIEEYKPKNILTYADRRYSNGNVYEKNGFKLIRETKPSYYYMKDYRQLESRMKFQKHKLKNKLEHFNPNLTEWENMQANGYDRIWDCGNLVYELIL